MDFFKNDGPSFFKIILSDSADHLQIPSAFANKYLKHVNNKKQTIVLKTKTKSGSAKWKVKYLKIQDRYYFKDGWLKFMNDNRLQFGHFLVFWRLSRSPKLAFKVYIYSPNGCLKTPTSRSDDENEAVVEKETVHKSSRVVTEFYIYRYPLTRCFTKATGILGYWNARLKNDDGNTWQVEVRKRGRNSYLTTGWVDFLRGNKVDIGDTCEIIHVQGNLFHVHVVKNKRTRTFKKKDMS